MDALLIPPRELLAPGMRLPLGLFTGGVLAGLWCLVSKAPWRETGDALAVAGATTIAIGRWGCLLAGCCTGAICGPWARPFCWRYGPGSEAYNVQLSAHVIEPGAALALPVHPLPLYFAASALVTLAVCLWLLRRNAPAGTLLAVFCILRPATKLLLEPLRAVHPVRRIDLMVALPAITLIVTVVVVVVPLLAAMLRSRRFANLRTA